MLFSQRYLVLRQRHWIIGCLQLHLHTNTDRYIFSPQWDSVVRTSCSVVCNCPSPNSRVAPAPDAWSMMILYTLNGRERGRAGLNSENGGWGSKVNAEDILYMLGLKMFGGGGANVPWSRHPLHKCNVGEKDRGGGGGVQYSGASDVDTSGTENGVLISEVS